MAISNKSKKISKKMKTKLKRIELRNHKTRNRKMIEVRYTSTHWSYLKKNKQK